MRLYLDTAPVIYLVEDVPPFAADEDVALLKDYDDYFEGVVSEILPLSAEVLDRATEIRAKYRFKTPDAIHLAAAILSGCDSFLTNDYRLDRFTEISIVTLETEPEG